MASTRTDQAPGAPRTANFEDALKNAFAALHEDSDDETMPELEPILHTPHACSNAEISEDAAYDSGDEDMPALEIVFPPGEFYAGFEHDNKTPAIAGPGKSKPSGSSCGNFFTPAWSGAMREQLLREQLLLDIVDVKMRLRAKAYAGGTFQSLAHRVSDPSWMTFGGVQSIGMTDGEAIERAWCLPTYDVACRAACGECAEFIHPKEGPGYANKSALPPVKAKL
ncbi:hypothetical protein PENSPDRAFT_694159 [Peniophora sp. CONT]|nr:hypothetical protein PENSPDRAFT_694159 [Peniophora sp. CONT]